MSLIIFGFRGTAIPMSISKLHFVCVFPVAAQTACPQHNNLDLSTKQYEIVKFSYYVGT
jgi:hypothetical protein